MAFNPENLVIVDNISWLKGFVDQFYQSIGKRVIRMPSSVPLSKSIKRFKDAEKILVHWESSHRHGGAVLEELTEIDPSTDLSERVIVLTTNPAHEDVIYFNELDIHQVVRLDSSKPGLARAAKELKNYYNAEKSANKGLAFWKKLQRALEKLMTSGGSESQIHAVERALQQLASRSPGKVSATYLDGKAILAYVSGHPAQAEQFWQEAIAINPNYYRAQSHLTLFYEKEKRHEDALRMIHQLNRKNKNSISRMVQLGRVHRDIKQDDRAEHYFNLALEKDSFCSRALNGLAEIRFDQGQFEEAKALLERSQSSIQTASYLNQKGIQLVRCKKFQEALELYHNAQYVLPNQDKGPLLFYNIGLCYSRWGKLEMATEYLRLALIKKPDYEKAEILLEKIRSLHPTN